MLEQFGPAVAQMPVREGTQECRVDDHRARLREGADQVLPAWVVDPGLAADGGIGHGQERGGHVDEGDPAEAGGGGEPGEVGDHAATEADDEIGTLDAVADEAVVDERDGCERLVLFAGGDSEFERREGCGFERAECAAREERANGGVGDHERAALEAESRGQWRRCCRASLRRPGRGRLPTAARTTAAVSGKVAAPGGRAPARPRPK